MTVQHIALVLDQPRAAFANSGQRLVMVALANHTDEGGVCWPSVRRIAQEAGLSEASTRRHIDALEAAGWLAKLGRRRRADGTLSVAVYRVDVTRLHRAALRGGDGSPARAGARHQRAQVSALNPHKNPQTGTTCTDSQQSTAQECAVDEGLHLPGSGWIGERPLSPVAQAALDALDGPAGEVIELPVRDGRR